DPGTARGPDAMRAGGGGRAGALRADRDPRLLEGPRAHRGRLPAAPAAPGGGDGRVLGRPGETRRGGVPLLRQPPRPVDRVARLLRRTGRDPGRAVCLRGDRRRRGDLAAGPAPGGGDPCLRGAGAGRLARAAERLRARGAAALHAPDQDRSARRATAHAERQTRCPGAQAGAGRGACRAGPRDRSRLIGDMASTSEHQMSRSARVRSLLSREGQIVLRANPFGTQADYAQLLHGPVEWKRLLSLAEHERATLPLWRVIRNSPLAAGGDGAKALRALAQVWEFKLFHLERMFEEAIAAFAHEGITVLLLKG